MTDDLVSAETAKAYTQREVAKWAVAFGFIGFLLGVIAGGVIMAQTIPQVVRDVVTEKFICFEKPAEGEFP